MRRPAVTSDGMETGFNAGQSDGGAQANPEDESNDEMDASKSEALLLGAIPIKIVDGIAYYEFRVDLNEANSGDDYADFARPVQALRRGLRPR